MSTRTPPTRYVFVNDQGGVFSSQDEPTAEDLDFAQAGLLLIIRLSDFQYFGTRDGWRPIPESILGQVDIDGETSRPFHAVPAELKPRE